MNDRIKYLLANQEMAAEPFLAGIQSNCWGTVCYVLGIENQVEDVWESWLNDNNFRSPDKEIIMPFDERPGYVGQAPMDRFIRSCMDRSREPDIIAYYSKWDSLVHCAIPIVKGLVFHQENIGGPWEIIPGNNYIRAGNAVKKKMFRLR